MGQLGVSTDQIDHYLGLANYTVLCDSTDSTDSTGSEEPVETDKLEEGSRESSRDKREEGSMESSRDKPKISLDNPLVGDPDDMPHLEGLDSDNSLFGSPQPTEKVHAREAREARANGLDSDNSLFGSPQPAEDAHAREVRGARAKGRGVREGRGARERPRRPTGPGRTTRRIRSIRPRRPRIYT